MKRPIIGIPQPGGFFNLAFFMIRIGVMIAGGIPRKITPNTPLDHPVDGIVIGGGTDIFPELFHGPVIAGYRYDHKRDAMEMNWLRIAEERKLPVLAICRGAQMMNVMNGGTLHPNVSEAYEDAIYPEGYWSYLVFRKTIFITPQSKMHEILRLPEYRVNSMHKQSIKDIGDRLIVSARERNGVVQVIERPSFPFYMGVQFHPELMLHRAGCREIFRSFVEACSGRRKKASDASFHAAEG